MSKCKNTSTAIDDLGNIIDLVRACKHQAYVCDFCKQKLYLRTSAYGKKHFVHQSNQYKRSHDFEVHKQIQKDIANHLNQFQIVHKLEYKLNKQFRADVIFNVNEKYYVIEIQRSPITIAEISRREQFYNKLGIRLIWILSKEQRNMKLTLWQQYLLVINNHVIFYDEIKEQYYNLLSYYKISSKKIRCNYRIFKFQNYLQYYIILKQQFQKIDVNLNSFLYYLKLWKQHYNLYTKKRDVLAYLFYELQQTVYDVENEFYSKDYLMFNFKPSCYWTQTLLYLLYTQKQYTKEFIFVFCKEQRLLLNDNKIEDIENYLLWLDQKKTNTNYIVK